MTCKQITEVVECARRGSQPGRELRQHLAACAPCRERLDAERQLTEQFQTLRIRVGAAMAPNSQEEASRREILMRDFAMANLSGLRRRSAFRSWGLALGAAAAVFASIFVGHLAGTYTRRTPPPATRTRGVRNPQTVIYQASWYQSGYEAGDEASEDASALSSDDFVAIPYTPPLAQGELVRVVHTDLQPEALASMGIDVDPVWANDIPADVVVGEDGIPRAVRITENQQN
jgi:hypothetical protein